MRIWRFIYRSFFILLLLGLVAGAVSLWFYVERMAEPVLQPVNPSYEGMPIMPRNPRGLKLEPFTFKGWDGGDVQAVVATRDGEESSRQLSVIGELSVHPADNLGDIDYVLISVEWNYGIQSALPLAESLTAAGLTCVLWEPRGSNMRRPYCTHGLMERRDVPLLLDELSARKGKEDLFAVLLGQGFGASMLLQAAPADRRVRAVAAVDAYSSLREALQRKMKKSLFTMPTLWLIDRRISMTVGYECFDVAPVEQASRIDVDVPVILANVIQGSEIVQLKDALNIYRQMPCTNKQVWTLREAGDPADKDSREIELRVGRDDKERLIKLDVKLMNDEEALAATIIRWLNDVAVPAVRAPGSLRVSRPDFKR